MSRPFSERGFIDELRLVPDRVVSFDDYPFSIPAVRALRDGLAFARGVTFFVGENGTGKSTLLEAIAVAAGFNAEGGSKNFNFATRATESSLHEAIRLSRSHRRPSTGFFLRAESLYNVATNIDELGVAYAYGGTSLHEQSHGEAVFAVLRHRFAAQGLYILDEPEVALSPKRQLALLVRMQELVTSGSQFIVATHSPIVMALPAAWIYQLSAAGIERVAYEDTEHFQLSQRFFEDRETLLQMLLAGARTQSR